LAGQAISFENADVVRRLLLPRIHNIRQDPLTFASTVPPNITIINDDIVNSFAQTANLGFSQLAHNLAIQLDGIYTRGSSNTVSANINTPDPVTGLKPLPEWRRILQGSPIGETKYRALRSGDRLPDEELSGQAETPWRPRVRSGPRRDRRWAVATAGARPHDPAIGPDGSVWYTGQANGTIGRLDPTTGRAREFPLKTLEGSAGLAAASTASPVWR
jgi:hypothetical protein